MPVEAFQLFMTYDPAVLSFTGDWDNFSFDGTIYEALYPKGDHQPGYASATPNPMTGILSIGIIGSVHKKGYEVPPGTDNIVAYIRATVSPDALPGSYTLELTNGPDGKGLKPPYDLLNELTHMGAARFVSEIPKTQAGRIGIVDDIIVFVRGDANSDGDVDITDPIFLLGHLYLGGRAPSCRCGGCRRQRRPGGHRCGGDPLDPLPGRRVGRDLPTLPGVRYGSHRRQPRTV